MVCPSAPRVSSSPYSSLPFSWASFLDWIEITLIVLPLVGPVVEGLGYNLVWFTVMFAVCLQTSFLTPPVGFALFYLKGVAPAGVKVTDIYLGVIPFILAPAHGSRTGVHLGGSRDVAAKRRLRLVDSAASANAGPGRAGAQMPSGIGKAQTRQRRANRWRGDKVPTNEEEIV